MPPSKEAVLQSIEPRYFVDYVKFSSHARDYIARTLSDVFRADPSEERRRFHLLSVVEMEYSAYEDAAALLKALLDWRAGKVLVPIEVLIGYKPGDARLDKVFIEHSVGSGPDLYERLRAAEWLPPDWSTWFPEHDLEKALRLACQFLALDCRSNQKALGIAAYNKIKHALMIVPSGKAYLASHPDVPSAIFANPGVEHTGSTEPFVVYGFPIENE